MATRANIFIREQHSDQEKQVIYAHWDGFPSGVGRDLERTLSLIQKDVNLKKSLLVDREALTAFICQHNPDWLNTTPSVAGDAEYIYEIDLGRRRVDYQHLSINGDVLDEEFLCSL